MANFSSIHILFFVFITSGIAVSSTVFTLQNSCPYTVWPGILAGNSNTLGDGGFPSDSRSFRTAHVTSGIVFC
ncbi:unnamed protein product [Arabis nemorensis]|uniref:Uncharacterized protein n=1 Tax=Arabis nemorensis TaxID=586526 RepID=A0A565BQY4_9BRAS|nr:unnamed protein product [Arabis nemorensis]